MAPTGLGALGTAVVPWLLTGGTLALGSPDRVSSLVSALPETTTVVIAPSSLMRRIDHEMSRVGKTGRLISISHGANADPDPFPGDRLVVDATVLGELALVPQRRAPRGPALDLLIATEGAPGPGLVELRLKGQPRRAGDVATLGSMVAEIQARGSAVPDAAFPVSAERGDSPSPEAGWLATGFRGQLSAIETPRVRVLDAGDERAQVGRHLVSLAALDRMARACPGILDAAAYAMPDPVMGARIELAVVQSQGAGWSPEQVMRGLDRAHVALPALPSRIVPVTRVPRDEGGTVRRADLAAAAAGARG
jgi:acyl-CoA synthetase (AMP-forming)/AMP-acid ligase II